MRTIYFDLETGGLDGRRHAITQFAAVVVGPDWKVIEELEMKIKFQAHNAEPEALVVNHFNAELWAAEAITPKDARQRMEELFKKYKDKTNTSKKTGRAYNVAQGAGHNANKFDRPFLGHWWDRLGKGDWCSLDWRVLDTMALAHWHCQVHGLSTDSLQLGDLAELFDIKVEGPAHDALVDVHQTIALAKYLTEKK